jgi:hypothetical protein
MKHITSSERTRSWKTLVVVSGALRGWQKHSKVNEGLTSERTADPEVARSIVVFMAALLKVFLAPSGVVTY